MRHRWLLDLAMLSAVPLLAVVPARTQTESTKQNSHAGKTTAVPDPPLIDLAGYQQLIAKYHEKALVVNFWATWCEPCRDEYPLIVELAKQFKPEGVNVIGIDMDDQSDMNLVRRFLLRTQPTFSNYRQRPGINLDAFYDGINPEWKGTMPQTIFYGKDGNIIGFFLGTRPRPVFEQAFRATLGALSNGTD
jgi:thiol-disulfide isomerase/thioredoxin